MEQDEEDEHWEPSQLVPAGQVPQAPMEDW